MDVRNDAISLIFFAFSAGKPKRHFRPDVYGDYQFIYYLCLLLTEKPIYTTYFVAYVFPKTMQDS